MAATPTLKGKLTLNDNQFFGGLRKATKGAFAFARGVSGALKSALTGPLAGIAVALAGIFGAGQFAGAVKGALDLGGSLVDLRAQTGGAIDELLVFRQVLKDNGSAAENARSILNKTQKTIAEAANGSKMAAKGLAAIGLEARDLVNKSPVAQFRAIADGIAQIPDPAQRAAAAMKIFGKSGGEILGVLSNAPSFEEAAKSLGRQSKLLAINADNFDTISDRLGRAGLKVQGFFIGVTSKLAPTLLKLTEILDGMDFAEQGERFGAGLQTAIEILTGIFKDPETFMGAWKDFIVAGALDVGNVLARVGIKGGQLFMAGLKLGGDILLGSATQFAGLVTEGLAEAGTALTAGLIFAVEKALEFFDGGWRKVLTNVGVGLANAFGFAMDALKKGFSAIWQGAKSFWERLLKAIAMVPGVGKTAKEALTNAFGKDPNTGEAFAPGKTGSFEARSFEEILSETSKMGMFKAARKMGLELQEKGGGMIDKALADFHENTKKIIAAEMDQDFFGAAEYRKRANDALRRLRDAGRTAIGVSSPGATMSPALRSTALQTGGLRTGGLQTSGGLGGGAYNVVRRGDAARRKAMEKEQKAGVESLLKANNDTLADMLALQREAWGN